MTNKFNMVEKLPNVGFTYILLPLATFFKLENFVVVNILATVWLNMPMLQGQAAQVFCGDMFAETLTKAVH